MAIQYKRILLKVSGEALSGPKGTGFDEETIASICAGIKAAHDLGAQIGIVVGGGNFWRGRSSGKMDRMDADKIGMLATVMNALAVKDALRQQGVDAVVMTSSFMPQVAECFTSDKAIAALESGKIVVFGGGTGNPIFSTDTASALRALEIGADAMFKATMVDGVYDKDPHKYADAVRYDTLTFTRVLDERLAVMDSTAATLCRDNGLPILVFDLGQPANIAKAVKGESVGTLVTVDYYGSPTPIQQIAAVAVAEARILTISPWDRSMLKPISKAIQTSDIGINPIDDGQVIRLVFPAPTEERRKQLTKDVKKQGEDAKTAVRNIRRDAMDKFKAMKKAGELTEDDQKKLEEETQKLTDKYVKLIDDTCADKNKEIMEV